MIRRNFIKLSAAAVTATLFSKLAFSCTPGNQLMAYPDEAWAQIDNEWVKLNGCNSSFTYKDVGVEVKSTGATQAVYIHSPVNQLMAIRLKWRYENTKHLKVLGDHWERSYGDLGWKAPDQALKCPWYF